LNAESGIAIEIEPPVVTFSDSARESASGLLERHHASGLQGFGHNLPPDQKSSEQLRRAGAISSPLPVVNWPPRLSGALRRQLCAHQQDGDGAQSGLCCRLDAHRASTRRIRTSRRRWQMPRYRGSNPRCGPDRASCEAATSPSAERRGAVLPGLITMAAGSLPL
jgi:hypothetical protein